MPNCYEDFGHERNGICAKGGRSCQEPASEPSIIALGMFVCPGCLDDERAYDRESIAYAEEVALGHIAERFEFRVAEAQARMAWGNA